MVDITSDSAVSGDILKQLRVEKGGRRVLGSLDERSKALTILQDSDCSTKITAGGSVANTLVGISRLSKASRRKKIHVALSSSCSTDAIGQYFSASLNNAGVAVLPSEDVGHTGTVFVLASPDGQRSFLSYFQSEHMKVSTSLRVAVSQCRLVVVEGYMWEMPGAAEAITEVVAIAKAHGVQVAMTAGDPGVVARNRDKILQVLNLGGRDILFFSNQEEACELLGKGRVCGANTAILGLGSLCGVAVVTDGSRGSFVSCMGQVHTIPAAEVPTGVVDTCGAGDAYAAGFCYAIMTGHDCASAGAFASSTAAQVIARHGAQLLESEAQELVELLPETLPLAVSATWLSKSAAA
ncbi:hypothetical protein CEUSTIGMA_g10380.t1 [Chlamydomonas eustigma]|uniref:Carbohydrate kinase PfkB domain-containing protein n=1 Tax=Chlamydomonas eustigma TaxID=1157962 RepID=A0A250XIT5_9CHLO|nr:hypothetical protein CEUSTIGMA_g10380.t1 [Chlamydomonas eustigma]|eukprot:GAX82953.1 hypothetical protein CEUSTIGMA_g10380.t1 [Chlamydomonas eustigma]